MGGGYRLREGTQAGEEGQGNDDAVVVPRIFVDNGGRRVGDTPPPRLTSFTPPHWGGFFSCVVNDDGGGV